MFKQLWATKHPHAAHEDANGLSLRRHLGPWGLTALGIGAVIGGGIFVITGQAAANHAGPAIMLSFVLAAICCAFCALAYAEFASMVPVSGSAYTYTYATFGELSAWFIGWMLVLEYGVSASAVAVSWTGYFLSLLSQFDIHLPAALVSAPLDAQLRPTGAIANLPAAALVLLLTWLCYVGISKSSAMNMAMVVLKTGLILLVIVVGWKYVDTSNWTPFIPANEGPGKYGMEGVLRGAAMVFFAYIGFEAVSVAAQESKNPQLDMPFGMMLSLVICTVLYIAMAAVMTGLVPFQLLGTDEPVVTAVAAHPQLGWLRWVVEVGALVGLSSVVLVMIIGQPRIFMIMGRDGLLPPVFTRIHPKYRTPHINTVITGIGIALLAALFPLDILGELTSMGTLIAFAAVCAGVLILRRTQPDLPRPFRMPMAWLICSLGVLSCLALLSAMTMHNWMLMGVWTFVGFVIYFCYGFRHSRLRAK
ncbi:amino acid permease [Stenotrophomonas maltophilia]|uniref:amino acid permease n=1 Tax=Stenotrophomonas maltophilia TaxID=40324 RepID=UPI0012B0407A|nr:amino acid permease [Stenotrophomonas maltophilia]QGL67641.1 amino acid permease [Stenotrophomonas maltophilia]